MPKLSSNSGMTRIVYALFPSAYTLFRHLVASSIQVLSNNVSLSLKKRHQILSTQKRKRAALQCRSVGQWRIHAAALQASPAVHVGAFGSYLSMYRPRLAYTTALELEISRFLSHLITRVCYTSKYIFQFNTLQELL